MQRHRRLDPLPQAAISRVRPHAREHLVDERAPVGCPCDIGHPRDHAVRFAGHHGVLDLADQCLPLVPVPDALRRDDDVADVEALKRHRVEQRCELGSEVGQHLVWKLTVIDLEACLR